MKRQKGFTLLELIIAITIFAISCTAIYSSFNVGINAWRKAEKAYEARQQARRALEIVSRELRGAINFMLKDADGSLKDSFEGYSDKVSFWCDMKASEFKEKKEEGIFKITYYVKSGSLYRKAQRYKREEAEAESVLIDAVSELKFEYAYADVEKIWWAKIWKKADSEPLPLVPLAVRVSLIYASANEEGEAEFSDVVVIPTGSFKTKDLAPSS